MEFNNKEVAEKYESIMGKDRTIHVPGIYSGLLSNITTKAAERMVIDKSNLITAKKSTTTAAAKTNDNGTVKTT